MSLCRICDHWLPITDHKDDVHQSKVFAQVHFWTTLKGNGTPRVLSIIRPMLIDVSHKPSSRLSLLSVRPGSWLPSQLQSVTTLGWCQFILLGEQRRVNDFPAERLGIKPTSCRLLVQWLIDWAGLNIPLNTLQVISRMGFYGSNDPINSIKALKEVVFLRIGFNPTRSTSPCYKARKLHCVSKTVPTF